MTARVKELTAAVLDGKADPVELIELLITHTGACSVDPHRADDTHDLAYVDLRQIMIMGEDFDLLPPEVESDVAESLVTAVKVLRDSPDLRDRLSTLALEMSLCPIHFCDYAICFDDSNPECAAVRVAFPSHDT